MRTRLIVLFVASVFMAGAVNGELVDYTISNGAIAEPLTDEPGDVRRGMTVAANSAIGNCIICHPIPLPDIPAGAFGSLGPPLAGVGDRYTEGQLRLRIVDPRALNPATIMPAYYKTEGLVRVAEEYEGEPILTAQEVEDLVAFLMTLTNETAE